MSCFWCHRVDCCFIVLSIGFFFHFLQWYNPPYSSDKSEVLWCKNEARRKSETTQMRKLMEENLVRLFYQLLFPNVSNELSISVDTSCPSMVLKMDIPWKVSKSTCWGRSCDMIESSTTATKWLSSWDCFKVVLFIWFYKHMVHGRLSQAAHSRHVHNQ